MKKRYRQGKLSAETAAVVAQANEIIEEYEADGFVLTLRQLYYQFVARDLLPNTPQSYKRLGDIINNGRMLGYVDWNAIEDRTRNLEVVATWDSVRELLQASAEQFRLDPWERQPAYVEVWVEKEALAGIVERVANELRVPYFSCRGYTSQSEMRAAGVRLKNKHTQGKVVHVLHLGDHDPSGIDMSRDIVDRLELFMGARLLQFQRLALNMDQVEEHDLPPNPVKLTDSRATDYGQRYGDESWELDALDPSIISGLVRDAVTALRDEDAWNAVLAEESTEKAKLWDVIEEWDNDADEDDDDDDE